MVEPLTYRVMREFRQAAQRYHRLETVRAKFKKARQERNLDMIIVVTRKIHDNGFQKSPRLSMRYDKVLMRMGEM